MYTGGHSLGTPSDARGLILADEPAVRPVVPPVAVDGVAIPQALAARGVGGPRGLAAERASVATAGGVGVDAAAAAAAAGAGGRGGRVVARRARRGGVAAVGAGTAILVAGVSGGARAEERPGRADEVLGEEPTQPLPRPRGLASPPRVRGSLLAAAGWAWRWMLRHRASALRTSVCRSRMNAGV